MAYSKQTWHDEPTKDTPISAARLGHIEDGIEAAASTADSASATAAAHTTALAGKQPLDADLTAVAALDSTAAGVIASDGAGWVSKTYTALKTALGLVKADVGLGNVDNTADTAKPVSTAQQTALNLKADLASPALTGNPTAPTQTAANNSTRVATTAFVATAVSGTSLPAQTGNGGKFLQTDGAATSWATAGTSVALPSTFVSKTTAYTAATGDFVEADTTSAGFTVTLPTNPAAGTLVSVKKISADTNTLTIAPAGGGTIDGASNAQTAITNAGAVFEHKGSNVWRIASVMTTAGAAATVAVGTVATGTAGSSVVITNAGTSTAAVLNFTIPKGDKGDTGLTGAAGPAGSSLQLQDEGSNLTVRSTVNFVGDLVTPTDDAANSRTIVTVASAYVPGWHTGAYYSGLVQRGGNALLTSGGLNAFAFYCPTVKTWDRISCYVITAGSGGTPVIRLGIYANKAGDSMPDALVLDAGTVDASTSGQKDITISQSLGPGWYWLVSAAQGATTTQPTVVTVGSPNNVQLGISFPAVGTTNIAANVLSNTLGITGVSGALPGAWGSTYQVGSNTAMVWLRA